MIVKKVLIVDDDEEDLEIFLMAAQQINAGINVHTAGSKEELFAILEDWLPDIVFIDSIIQNENGISLVTELKAIEKYTDLPVIMYSGSDDITNVKKAFSNGASAYVVKPHRLTEVKAVLGDFFQRNWKTDVRKPYYLEGTFHYFE